MKRGALTTVELRQQRAALQQVFFKLRESVLQWDKATKEGKVSLEGLLNISTQLESWPYMLVGALKKAEQLRQRGRSALKRAYVTQWDKLQLQLSQMESSVSVVELGLEGLKALVAEAPNVVVFRTLSSSSLHRMYSTVFGMMKDQLEVRFVS
jgi:hypothetical protein